jgi:hypothetical protein
MARLSGGSSAVGDAAAETVAASRTTGRTARRLRPPAGGSDASGPPVADLDFGSFDDDRDRTVPLGELQHLLEERAVLENIEVLNVEPVFGVGLTGRRRVGSGVLAENAYSPGHGRTLRKRKAAW